MRVGAFIVPDAGDPATTVRQIEAADDAGEVVPFAVELRGGDPVISEWLRA
jgi:hypothetical protein